eukprot:7615972-Karenia_brevis.AAC.2
MLEQRPSLGSRICKGMFTLDRKPGVRDGKPLRALNFDCVDLPDLGEAAFVQHMMKTTTAAWKSQLQTAHNHLSYRNSTLLIVSLLMVRASNATSELEGPRHFQRCAATAVRVSRSK